MQAFLRVNSPSGPQYMLCWLKSVEPVRRDMEGRLWRPVNLRLSVQRGLLRAGSHDLRADPDGRQPLFNERHELRVRLGRPVVDWLLHMAQEGRCASLSVDESDGALQAHVRCGDTQGILKVHGVVEAELTLAQPQPEQLGLLFALQEVGSLPNGPGALFVRWPGDGEVEMPAARMSA